VEQDGIGSAEVRSRLEVIRAADAGTAGAPGTNPDRDQAPAIDRLRNMGSVAGKAGGTSAPLERICPIEPDCKGIGNRAGTAGTP
jgi:hypothetical protein